VRALFDLSPLKLLVVLIVGMLVLGPDKLPDMISRAMGFLRAVRAMADSAKQEIRDELGPEFKDFEFEDLNPKTFVRKQLLGDGDDPLGLKDLKDSVDLKSALNGEPSRTPSASVDFSKPAAPANSGPALGAGERPPFDPDAT